MLSDMGVSNYTIFYPLFSFQPKATNTEEGRVPSPPPSSSALVLSDQDSTIATLKHAAAGVPFSL